MSQKPRKLQRVSKACDFCNRRSIKCRQSEDSLGRCQNCADFDVPCTFDRPARRRGVRVGTRASGCDAQFARTSVGHDIPTAAATASGGKASGSATSRSSYHPSISGDPWSTFNHGWSAIEGNDDGALHNSWKAFAVACDRQIRNLVQVYFEIVYPIFPLFHMPSFIEHVNNKKHLRNQGLFASTMAVCSLVSGRVRDGALYSNRWDRDELIDPPSEAFFAAARDSIPRDLIAVKGDISKDLFGFQSANIQATLQLLRMVVLSTEEIGVERKCDVAEEVFSVFSNVPVEYLKAISSPLLHHLGGIGYILGSVMEGDLSESYYTRVRTLLLEIADLLQRLETGLHRDSGVGQRLRSQVGRIDGYMCSSLLLDLDTPSNAMQIIDAKADPAVPPAYAQGTPASGASPSTGLNQMPQFQLPPELLSDWPWPLDTCNAEGFLPLAFE